MSFLKKTWLARLGVGLNRFRMNNSTDVVLESNPISVTQQGDQLSADNMNNLETRIGNAFDEMAGNLATIEVSPSLHNWTVGSQIVYNGILYKVTSAISTDDNLVVGTNIEPYPVSSALSDIIASLTPVLLWSNDAPTSAFDAQTIPLNLSTYSTIHIIFKNAKNGGTYFQSVLRSTAISTEVFGERSGKLIYRGVMWNSNRVTFNTGRALNPYGTETVDNDLMIPMGIYGNK